MTTPRDPLDNPPAPALTHQPGKLGAVPVSGPSGLSDYAVSPLGVPIALLRDEVRVAFLGRTSTEDQQDPRQSLIRQLGNSKTDPRIVGDRRQVLRRRVRPHGVVRAGPEDQL